MSAQPEPNDALVEQLAAYAAAWTGFNTQAIPQHAMRRALNQLAVGHSVQQLLDRAARGDRQLMDALCEAVSVGETYFFRHPEHFEYVASQVVPARLAEGPAHFRAWSAGCATGEEAYSIAACLRACCLPGTGVGLEVLGTDLLARNLAVAREGLYAPWSLREAGPVLYPLFRRVGKDKVRVNDELRAITSFAVHNLLDAPPGGAGPFDLILCRNVLVYFTPAAIRAVCARLAEALAPGGVIIFGTMDVDGPPPGLVRAGPAGVQAFTRPKARPVPPPPRQARPELAPPPPPSAPRAAEKRPPEPVALHLRALAFIERGERRSAEKILGDLCRTAPDYLPGILERALLHVRGGEWTAATGLMREVLRRASALPAEQLLPGPEPLPAEYYRASAQAFFENREPCE